MPGLIFLIFGIISEGIAVSVKFIPAGQVSAELFAVGFGAIFLARNSVRRFLMAIVLALLFAVIDLSILFFCRTSNSDVHSGDVPLIYVMIFIVAKVVFLAFISMVASMLRAPRSFR